MKITKTQLRSIIKEELSSVISEKEVIDKEKAIDVAKKVTDTDVGDKLSQIAMKDPEIRKVVYDLASQINAEAEQLDEQMSATMTMSGFMGGPLAYLALGQPGFEHLVSLLGSAAGANIASFGATIVAGMALGLVADVAIALSGAR